MIYLKTKMHTMPKGCVECGYYGSGVERNAYEPVCGAVSSRISYVTPLPQSRDLKIFKPKWCPLVDSLNENKGG